MNIEKLDPEPAERPETVGELHDRLPVDEWVTLPNVGLRVKRLPSFDGTGIDSWRVHHPGIGVLAYDSEAEARVAAGTAGRVYAPGESHRSTT